MRNDSENCLPHGPYHCLVSQVQFALCCRLLVHIECAAEPRFLNFLPTPTHAVVLNLSCRIQYRFSLQSDAARARQV